MSGILYSIGNLFCSPVAAPAAVAPAVNGDDDDGPRGGGGGGVRRRDARGERRRSRDRDADDRDDEEGDGDRSPGDGTVNDDVRGASNASSDDDDTAEARSLETQAVGRSNVDQGGEAAVSAGDERTKTALADDGIGVFESTAVRCLCTQTVTSPSGIRSNDNDFRGETAAAALAHDANDDRTEGTATDEAHPKSSLSEKGSPSPLDDFFSHLGFEEGSSEEGQTVPMSLREWKEARRRMLRGYLTARLMKGEDNGDTESVISANDIDDDDDGCSFSSDVMDGPFECSQSHVGTPSSDAKNNSVEVGDEDEDHIHLETQPQPAVTLQASPKYDKFGPAASKGSAASSNFGEVVENDECNLPFYHTQEEGGLMEMMNLGRLETHENQLTPAVSATPCRGIFSGTKRKLGFNTNHQPGEETKEAEQKSAMSKRPRSDRSEPSSRPHQKQKRGLMWDGKFESVLHVDDTLPSPCSNLAELDLSSPTLNLSLCRVLRTWNARSTRRMDALASSRHCGGSNEDLEQSKAPSRPDPHDAFVALFDSCEDDGPLNTIYRRVFSVEIAQLLEEDENVDNNTQRGQPPVALSSPSFATMAAAAFSEGRGRLEREASRRRRRSVRRVRVFFYDAHADAVSAAFDDLSRDGKNKEKKRPPTFLMSLVNVPAECIVPQSIARGVDPRLQQYISNSLGDEDFGTMSPYCVCVGDVSAIRFGEEKLQFNSEEMEIRLVRAPKDDSKDNSNNMFDHENDLLIDYDTVITAASARDRDNDHGYFTECEESILARRYARMRKKRAGEPIVFNPGDEERASLSISTNTAINAAQRDIAGMTPVLRDSSDRNAEATTNGESANVDMSRRTTAREETMEAGMITAVGCHRPRSAVPLCNLLPLLIRNNMKRLNAPIDVYGVVLGFSPPSLTRTEEWSMSISFIDETLPVSIRSQAGRSLYNNGKNSGGGNEPKELHVPSVTLVLFAKDKSKLPVAGSAGDVICCIKVSLSIWSGEPQLCTRRTSKIVILSPRRPRVPGDGELLHNSTSPNDYSTSCSCCCDPDSRGGGTTTSHSNLCWPLANGLWRWGQMRLSAHPTMSPNRYLSIAKAVGGDGDDDRNERDFETPVSGDLTAAVTAIIPTPEHLRQRDTPRGYLRLWDGTGRSLTDPLPLSIPGVSNKQSLCDPPEEILIRVEKIIRSISSSSGPQNHLGRDDAIQAPIALCGKVINAIIWEENLWNFIHRENMIDVGSFVRLRNVNSAKLPTTGTKCLSVHIKSSLTPLPFDAYEIKDLLKGHAALILRGVPTNPTSAILPASSDGGSSNGRPGVDIVQEMKNNGLSMLEECLRTPPPETFTVQFEVSHTVPSCNPISVDELKALHVRKKDGTFSFRFALHIKDASSEVDVLCLGKVAEELLGITPRDILSKRTSEKCQGALDALREIMSSGSICEGKIRSVLGKDGKLYFILKSIFCITAESV